MAALKEARSYGLSCGRVSDGSKVSVFHVKLTDSALKAFESYRANQDSVSLRPSIRFQGSQGHICIPQPDCPAEARTFSFYLSNIGRDSPQGSFDCIQQYVSSRGDVLLDCLGSIQDKITVCATDDSYQKARQSMAQAEEETRSRSAIVIKAGGRYLGKKVQFRKPAPGATDAVPSRKRATPMNLASAIRKSGIGGVSGGGGVSQRPFRDRVLHLLALRPYRKAELLLRLQKDGLAQADKEALDGLLQQVANVSTKDGTCTLRDCMYKDVQKDWPGYSEGDQQLLKRVLVRKLCQPQSAGGLPGDPAASSPPGEHGSSASPPQKRPQPPEFIDPLANKRPRISHFTQRAQPATVNGKLGVPNGREALLPSPGPPAIADVLSSSAHLSPRLEPPRAHDPLADVSNDLGHSSRDCERGDAAIPGPTVHLGLPLPTDCAQPGRPHGSPSRSKSRKKCKKHKDKERAAEDRHQPQPPDHAPPTLGAPPDAPGRCLGRPGQGFCRRALPCATLTLGGRGAAGGCGRGAALPASPLFASPARPAVVPRVLAPRRVSDPLGCKCKLGQRPGGLGPVTLAVAVTVCQASTGAGAHGGVTCSKRDRSQASALATRRPWTRGGGWRGSQPHLKRHGAGAMGRAGRTSVAPRPPVASCSLPRSVGFGLQERIGGMESQEDPETRMPAAGSGCGAGSLFTEQRTLCGESARWLRAVRDVSR
ncbi:RNA polymerase II elongation factor ELL isoform X1 [Eulemur rufifrons]|uniref:RNA polymerase II elongation factor ELL isoform X1 n=1 Tax=Eulemur rufifrons TaxID=859984 RepID=UPI0037432C84